MIWWWKGVQVEGKHSVCDSQSLVGLCPCPGTFTIVSKLALPQATQEGRREMEVGKFFFSMSYKAIIKLFLLEYWLFCGKCSSYISKWLVSPPSPARNTKISSCFSLWELGGISGKNSWNYWDPLRLQPPRVSHSHTEEHPASRNLPNLSLKWISVYESRSICSWKQISAVIFYIQLSLQIWDGDVPWDLNSLRGLRKVIDFHFFSIFFLL